MLRYTAYTNDGMQRIALAIAEDSFGRCRQDRGTDYLGRPSMTVYDSSGRVLAEIRSAQNVSHLAGQTH